MRIAAADWSIHPRKRWVCESVDNVVSAPRRIIDPASLLEGPGPAVVGFDFPIGLPEAYCRAAQIPRFIETLHRDWQVSNQPTLHQPFFPKSPKGSKAMLEAALKLNRGEWLRQCDRQSKAGALFWTLGPKQVGRAAITGWSEVLRHRPAHWKIWPFDAIDPQSDCWIAEIYPALAYPSNLGKQHQDKRRSQAGEFFKKAAELNLRLEPGLVHQIRDGFGPSQSGEDPFDAFAGLLHMVQHYRTPAAPTTPAIRQCEGWILGLRSS